MPTVAFVVNDLGIGGTERGMATQAIALSGGPFEVRVVSLGPTGPLQQSLGQAGVRVDAVEGSLPTLVEALRGVDVAVQLREGDAAPLLPMAARLASVPHLVEWSMFGKVDRSPDREQFDCHLFVSRMIALRYRKWIGKPASCFHERHRVQPLPIDPLLAARAPPPREARISLGLDPDRPVVGRVGRAVDIKWRNLLIDMIPFLHRAAPGTQVLLVGATPAKIKRLHARDLLDGCRLIEPTPDEERLAAIYAACDVFVSASRIGESQGLAILEAMSLGIPVVTCSMPWADNAQIEFVEHGRTGLIADHPRAFGEAVAELVRTPTLRDELGTNAREMVARNLGPGALGAQLVSLFSALMETGRPPAQWSPSPPELDAFAAEYKRRLGLSYRRLNARERVEVLAARARESAAAHLRAIPSRTHMTR